jgi:hypothetical protein
MTHNKMNAHGPIIIIKQTYREKKERRGTRDNRGEFGALLADHAKLPNVAYGPGPMSHDR